MRSRTLVNLRADVRELCDIPNDDEFVTNANLNERINRSIARLYWKLVQAQGADHYEKSATFTTSAGVNEYSFSAMTPAVTDFARLIQIEISDGTLRRVMQPFMRKEHGQWLEAQVPGGHTVTLYYVPAPVRLTADGDSFDGIAGFEDWVVNDVAIGVAGKEESDTSEFRATKQEIDRQIMGFAASRDASFPKRITDTARGASSQLFSGGIPRYRLMGATGITGAEGAAQKVELAWGRAPWFGY